MGETTTKISSDPRVYTNDAQTILVRVWANGAIDVCTRRFDPSDVWSPAIPVVEVKP